MDFVSEFDVDEIPVIDTYVKTSATASLTRLDFRERWPFYADHEVH